MRIPELLLADQSTESRQSKQPSLVRIRSSLKAYPYQSNILQLLRQSRFSPSTSSTWPQLTFTGMRSFAVNEAFQSQASLPRSLVPSLGSGTRVTVRANREANLKVSTQQANSYVSRPVESRLPCAPNKVSQ